MNYDNQNQSKINPKPFQNQSKNDINMDWQDIPVQSDSYLFYFDHNHGSKK